MHRITDGSDPAPGADGEIVSARLFFDNRGHVSNVSFGAITLPSGSLDELVAADNGTVPGYLDDVLNTPDNWLGKLVNGNVLELTHEDADAVVVDTVLNNVAEAGGTITFTYADTEFDAKGHYTNDNADTFTLDILAASDPWLSIAAAAGGATLAHTGPGVTDTTIDSIVLGANVSGSGLDVDIRTFEFDARGHYVQIDDNTTSISYIGDDYISAVTSNDAGDVDVNISHKSAGLDASPVSTVTYTGGTGIDVTGNTTQDYDGAGHFHGGPTDTVTITLDLTEVSGYNGSAKQVLMNDNGTIKWQNTAECP